MAIRRRTLSPDMLYEGPAGQVPCVSQQAFIDAVVDFATVCAVAGGAMSVVTLRGATGLDHEMVTVGAVLEWKDRTDAKPQSEPNVLAPAFEERAEELAEEHSREMATAAVSGAAEQLVGVGNVQEQVAEMMAEPSPEERVAAAVGGAGLSAEDAPPRVGVPAADVYEPPAESRSVRNADDGPAPPASAEGIDDGLVYVPGSEDVVDDSEIPEHLR